MDTWSNYSDCPICKGAGVVLPRIDGKVDYEHTIPCQCVVEENKKKRQSMLLKMCALPPFAENMRFDNFEVYTEVKSAYKSAKDMADKSGALCWLALLGDNGNGKTHLAVSICRAWIEKGIPAKYAFVSLLLDELREGYRSTDKENSFDEKFRMYCNISLLLLDDYGAESKTGWVQEKLDTLIDYRLMNNKSLIVTSNLSLDEMPSRIRSRLMRHPQSVIVGLMAGEYSMREKRNG